MKLIKNELKRVKFIEEAFHVINRIYLPSQFVDALNNNESLNEFYSLEEPSQIGVQLTAQISHAFYSYLKYRANENLIKHNSFLRVITTRKKDDNDQGSYDLVFRDINTLEDFYIEVKLSQNNNSWQGSTSSTSKVDLFLLVNFRIDRECKISDVDGSLFQGVFVAIVNMSDIKWSGSPKDNNHRTKFEFRVNDWDIDILRENSIIKGEVIAKQKVIHLILDTI
jgi:hypothetical protein